MNIIRSTIRPVLALGIGAALALTACGGDDDADDSGSTTTAAAAEATDDGGGAASAAENAITISDFSFSGATEVAVGTTVTVTNADATPHTWTAADGSFDSGAIAPGGSFEFTFTEAGRFAYSCNFHPSMTGLIVVTG